MEQIKLKYEKVQDSIKQEIKIVENISHLNFSNTKTGNYQAIFLLKVFDEKSHSIKNDSLFMFTNEKKIIFTSTQFIEQCIKRFNKN
ncbi:hypothetical protein [Chryseobacterium sp. EO14]|uniref:hypothetical protein n=1 Tax=Chryseobacterium sp. EO14 TaxID=2950551 RepID=UPI00210B7BA0|nr:hypothetical protein [Chryseobacterium sp. EO14]MCQ4142681.1 hypothetical protein [Chryseobacterium sp. EO14]